jgi:hypothetical protein
VKLEEGYLNGTERVGFTPGEYWESIGIGAVGGLGPVTTDEASKK